MNSAPPLPKFDTSYRPLTPQSHAEVCAQDNHDEILREIQSLRDAISPSVPTGSPSYADVARTPPLSHRATYGRSQRQIQHRPRSPTHCIAQLTPRGWLYISR
jgi:hypothetical protein